MYKCLFKRVILSHLDIYPEIGFMGHIVIRSNFMRNFHTAFHSHYTTLHSLQFTKVPFFHILPPSVISHFSDNRHSYMFISVTSVPQSCPTHCEPLNCSIPGIPVHHQLLELAQTRVHQVSDAIQSFHSLLSPSPPAFNLFQHKGLFQ